MRGLKGLLIRKIVITGILWCVPLLAFPSAWFVALGMPAPEPLMFARLLGAAYLALLAGYYIGMKGLTAGESPMPVIHMGIVSNGTACLLLAFFGFSGSWSAWGAGAQGFMWLSAAGATGITYNLLKYRRRFAKTNEEAKRAGVEF